VPNVTLTLTGTTSGSTLSDVSGNYTFSSLAAGGNYTVTPTKAALAPASAGINTVDVVAIQRHFLVLGTPLTGCRLTAADVDLNSSVNTIDVVAVQRFFLGSQTGIANVGKYKFTPASRTYPGLVSDQTAQNYDALVFGDVASGFVHRPEGGGDMIAGELAPTVAAVELPEVAADQSKTTFIAAVETSAIDAKNKLVGFQGDFIFDERVVRTLRISAFSNDFTPLSGSGTLFELKMTRAGTAGQSTQLVWRPPPDDFIFIEANLQTQTPGSTPRGVGMLSALAPKAGLRDGNAPGRK
jgi:hypothetical protein